VKGHRSVQIGLAIVAVLAASTCQASNIRPFHSSILHTVAATEAASIGVATMRPDGTIEFRLRATGPGGMVGEGFFTYPPIDPQYAEVLPIWVGSSPAKPRACHPGRIDDRLPAQLKSGVGAGQRSKRRPR
jgi:hypothetical protein